jgi:hypothetical protein
MIEAGGQSRILAEVPRQGDGLDGGIFSTSLRTGTTRDNPTVAGGRAAAVLCSDIDRLFANAP